MFYFPHISTKLCFSSYPYGFAMQSLHHIKNIFLVEKILEKPESKVGPNENGNYCYDKS